MERCFIEVSGFSMRPFKTCPLMNSLRLGYNCSALLRTAAFSHSQRPVDPSRCPARAAAFFHTSRQCRQISRPERYGTAKQPPPHLQDAGAEGERTANADDASKSAMEQLLASSEAQNDRQPEAKLETAASPSNLNPDHPPPSESVLNVEQQNASESSKPPHLKAPPYVHHFDSWTLVRDLQKGGFSQEQATTIMKAVRLLLANNMDLARDALVSKSNVENETYLFKAASSELKTEIQNSRKADADKWRSDRATVQYEVDILGQNMTQELAAIKDELRGLFDDRKMAVRMEQKQMEAKIQELNYKISVALNSDARGSVEGMRWILTRRAAMALAISGLMVLGTLNYSRYMTAAEEVKRKKQESDHAAADQLTGAVTKGSSQGLSEEVILAPEGVSGG